ncbi:MAG: hypothetical protein H6739_02600 [Alphaproteobacteria bacterium]|nr:hypothetical protein [Alphaproteobacteria bacterium]
MLLVLLLLACLTSPAEFRAMLDGVYDTDGDGFIDGKFPEEGGDDCDDEDPLTFPGAAEICDGRDNDCDDTVDEGLDDFYGLFRDLDGDGYGDPDAPVLACPVPEDAVADDGDCDDGNGAYNPEAADIVGDNIDQNCDAIDGTDADGDGIASMVSGGADCDDTDASVSPEAPEVPYNGVDDDCDPETGDDDVDGDGFNRADDCDDEDWTVYPGAREVCGDGRINDCWTSPDDAWEDCGWGATVDASDTRAMLLGIAEDQRAAGPFSAVGDVLYDNVPTIAITAPGTLSDVAPTIYFVDSFGRSSHHLSEASAWVSDEDAISVYAVESMGGLGDRTGDGVSELAILAYSLGSDGIPIGSVLMMNGPLVGAIDLNSPAGSISASSYEDSPFIALSTDGDMDGDGQLDWLAGAPFLLEGSTWVGGAWIGSWPGVGDFDISEVAYRLTGAESVQYTGWDLGFAGDWNGDGCDESLIGSRQSNRNGVSAGAAYLLNGPIEEDRYLDDADAVFLGEHDQDRAGGEFSAGKDINGDGFDDAVVGAKYHDDNKGIAYVLTSAPDGLFDLGDVQTTIRGEESWLLLGSSLALVDDLNGDDRAEILVGLPNTDLNGNSSGSAALFLSPVSGVLTPDDADVTFVGGASGDSLGAYVADLGDMDLDGLPDIGIGAPGYTDDLNDQGAIFIFYGEGP